MAEYLSSLTGVLQGSLNSALTRASSVLDRILPPEKRASIASSISRFATEKPLLASFLFSQIALSGVPIGLFIIMTITVIVFALLAALLVAVLVAAGFIVVAVGIALLVLLPTLFATTFAAAFLWAWAVGAYYIVKWFNKKDVPGIHTALGGGDKEEDRVEAKNEPNGVPAEQQQQQRICRADVQF